MESFSFISFYLFILKTIENKETILNNLAYYFGEEALYPLDYEEKNWSEDPFTGNCCYAAKNKMKSFSEIRRPIGRIFWAGTETSTYWYGHIAGAIQAGYRAGIEVIYDLRPQSLTVGDLNRLL